mmetsp:Transcript_57621/g.166827  ORF Transcript_57621/g.166827 Transcript_57621/m.166827 type:complete len:1106 (-) Transcript_57621:140-3457(-)
MVAPTATAVASSGARSGTSVRQSPALNAPLLGVLQQSDSGDDTSSSGGRSAAGGAGLSAGEEAESPKLRGTWQQALSHAVDSVVVQEVKEEGVLTRAEINEILASSSDPNFTLPLEAKYWSREQLQMFVLSQGLIRPKGCSIPDERLMANTNMSKEEIAHAFERAADWISSADALLIGSGAGMGVDSGLGTFRGGRRGVWQGLEEVGLAYEDICDAKWFQEEPRLAWAFWDHCHKVYQETTPHDGYTAVRSWGLKCPLGFYSFTSNIDSHWSASGVASDRILEVHGAVKWLQCSVPCCSDVWRAPKDLRLSATHTHRVAGDLPVCPKCKAVARPNVQMFGGDRGFSKARRESQFSKYDGWLKQLEARPDKDNLRIVCFEVGCGVTVPTVRKELETVMRKFPQSRLIRVNPENPGLAQDLVERGVSLPVAAGAAIEELGRQMEVGEPEVNFILLGRSGGGCSLRAPYRSSLGRVLRLASKEEGVHIDVEKHSRAQWMDMMGRREDISLDQPVPTAFFRELKEPGGDTFRPATTLTLDCDVRCQGHLRNFNDAFAKHVDEAGRMLDDMNALFGEPAYQEEVRKCRDRRAVMRHVRSVHCQVVPKYGFAASERGTAAMTQFIGSVQSVPEIQAKVELSMDLSYIAHMGHLPHVNSGSNLVQAASADVAPSMPSKSDSIGPGVGQQTGPEATLMMTITSIAPDGDEVESCRQEMNESATVGDLRTLLARAWAWDDSALHGTRIFAKEQGKLCELRDSDAIRKALFIRGTDDQALPPPLRLRKPGERIELALVDFESAAAGDAEALNAKVYRHATMSDLTVSELKGEVAMALGWSDAERKRVRFVKKLPMGFATLKEHERVEGKRTLYVRGAPLSQPSGSGTHKDAQKSANVVTAPATANRPDAEHGAGDMHARHASDPVVTSARWLVCQHHDWNGPMVEHMDASDLSKVRQHAEAKGYSGFSVWKGTAYFKAPGRQLRQSDLVYKGASVPVDFHLLAPSDAGEMASVEAGKGQLTTQEAVNLQRELMAGYGTDDFQQRLAQLRSGGNKSKYTGERLKLLLEVQAKILPRYGFQGNLQGAMEMMEAFRAKHLQGSKEVQENGALLERMIV